MGREIIMRADFDSFNLVVVMVVILATMTTRLTVVDGSYGHHGRHGRSYGHNKYRWYSTPPTSYTPSTSYAPSTSDTPSTSDIPLNSETPSTSYTPWTPDTPSTSETPSTSYTPWTPDTPSTSETPSTSYTPWTPDTPSTSETPSTSYTPWTPDTPSTSETPSTSYTPWTPETPSTSDMPSTSYSSSSTWISAHATFYGDETASETMGGACGYGNLYDSGYGFATAALSTVMFNNGKACGTCYEIKCVESKWCFTDAPSIKITATNLCPPNWYQSSDAGGWCNPPLSHFDLSKPMFMKIAEWTAGIVPVNYRQVPCGRTGGIRFQFQGNPYWLLVVVLNVGGDGDVSQMWVKGTQTDWISMSRNWGASFQAFSKLGGQPLSFKLQNAAGETVIAYDVCPTYWSTGQTYEANTNFIN